MRGRCAALKALPIVAVLSVASCGGPDRSGAPAQARPGAETAAQAPNLPDVAGLAPKLQERLRTQYAALRKASDDAAPPAVQSEAFGAVARLLLAAELPGSSEPFFERARALMPADPRWPYYLGHVARQTQRLQVAVRHFSDAIERRPDDVPALVWIADAHLALGEPQAAERHLARAVTAQPSSAAAWFRRGLAAVGRGEPRLGIEYLERARSLNPAADAIAYQLGMAYRGAGDLQKAAPLLRTPGDSASVVPADPLMDALPALVEGGGEFYVLRGLQAMEEKKWPDAVADLRTGADLLPADASVRVNLATALFLSGDGAGAREAAESATRIEPKLAKAHYVLGLILESSRLDSEAIEHLTTAVRLDPGYLEALASLGDALRRTGRVEDALTYYMQVLALNPNASQVRFGYGMGLVRLGRYREAVAWLDEGATLHPDQPGYLHAVARLLSAAPDAGVRDGVRARALMEALAQREKSAAVLETMAMALAETGRFADAASWQRRAIDVARGAGQRSAVPKLQADLAGYERNQPCREPWRPDDAVHRPGAQ